ncbi:MAG: iron dicitrate transport regulator FecR [Variovorax sp.]|nr:MAG: iron dicitrate transport regulator FecR [Variovorax sp.]
MTTAHRGSTAAAVLLGGFFFSAGLSAQPAKPQPAKGKAPASAAARVEFVQGAPTARPKPPATRRTVRGRTPPAVPAAPASSAVEQGSTLEEGTRIQVPDDGYLRLRLADGSVVRVLAGSDVELRRLRRRPTGAVESVIDVRRGKVESEVSPKTPGRVFEIHAPGAVASVRGTTFDVSVDDDGRVGTSVIKGKVAVQPKNARQQRTARSTTLDAGKGVVLDAKGRLGAQRTLPPAPDLSSWPENYEDANLLVLDFARAGLAAAGYEVRVARDEALHEVVRNGRFSAPHIQFPPLDDGVYTVGVRALDAEGLSGPESTRRIQVNAQPVPPLYQSPAPGARVMAETLELVCSQTAGTEGVHLQVARGGDFTRPVIDEPRLAVCRLGLAALPLGDYQWRVASIRTPAGGGIDHGPFAAPQPFSVVETPTVSALDVLDHNEQPTLTWQATAGQTFRAQLARDEAFTQIVVEADLTQPSWRLEGLARGTYFVRLQARDASGLTGPFSPPRRVRIGGVVQTSTGNSLSSSDGEPINRP